MLTRPCVADEDEQSAANNRDILYVRGQGRFPRSRSGGPGLTQSDET
jgi:hypothetical protein